MYPSGITDELVEMIAVEDRILPYLDMPIQHGSDAILQAMRRPERRSTILERVRWLREHVPDLTLRTTVIVGFPGETDQDFRALLDLLEELEFDRVGAFTYSIEEGTRAADMTNHVAESLKRERLEQLLDVQRGISLSRNQSLVGRRATALLDTIAEEDPDYDLIGRCASQAIDVDGVTYIGAGSFEARLGEFVEVEIVEASEHDLVAHIIEREGGE
jgi:ribosomal protein S12 methylthiotransferase